MTFDIIGVGLYILFIVILFSKIVFPEAKHFFKWFQFRFARWRYSRLCRNLYKKNLVLKEEDNRWIVYWNSEVKEVRRILMSHLVTQELDLASDSKNLAKIIKLYKDLPPITSNEQALYLLALESKN